MDEQYYKNLAQLLAERIEERHYFNGSVEMEADEYHILLRTSLIIYRQPLRDPSGPGNTSHITDIIPVWWDCETTGPYGIVTNDFSWSEFRPYLLGAV